MIADRQKGTAVVSTMTVTSTTPIQALESYLVVSITTTRIGRKMPVQRSEPASFMIALGQRSRLMLHN